MLDVMTERFRTTEEWLINFDSTLLFDFSKYTKTAFDCADVA